MNLGWWQTGRGKVHAHKDPELPSDCEREPVAETFDEAVMNYVHRATADDVDKAYEDGMEAVGFNRAEREYISLQICGAMEELEKRHADHLMSLSKAIDSKGNSSLDTQTRNVALQLAIASFTNAGLSDKTAEIVESARAYVNFIRGHDA